MGVRNEGMKEGTRWRDFNVGQGLSRWSRGRLILHPKSFFTKNRQNK